MTITSQHMDSCSIVDWSGGMSASCTAGLCQLLQAMDIISAVHNALLLLFCCCYCYCSVALQWSLSFIHYDTNVSKRTTSCSSHLSEIQVRIQIKYI